MDRREVEDRIQRECRPYLSLVSPDGFALYRGIDAQTPEFFEGRVDRNRKPTNMPTALHDAADAWFSRQFGVRFRSAALFCTGSKTQAGTYGRRYRIYPIGCFQFCWSPLVSDLHVWAVQNGILDKPPSVLVESLIELGYREEGLGEAITSGCEIMVACSRYYAVADDQD